MEQAMREKKQTDLILRRKLFYFLNVDHFLSFVNFVSTQNCLPGVRSWDTALIKGNTIVKLQKCNIVILISKMLGWWFWEES